MLSGLLYGKKVVELTLLLIRRKKEHKLLLLELHENCKILMDFVPMYNTPYDPTAMI